jgi:hypothetical protein
MVAKVAKVAKVAELSRHCEEAGVKDLADEAIYYDSSSSNPAGLPASDTCRDSRPLLLPTAFYAERSGSI